MLLFSSSFTFLSSFSFLPCLLHSCFKMKKYQMKSLETEVLDAVLLAFTRDKSLNCSWTPFLLLFNNIC